MEAPVRGDGQIESRESAIDKLPEHFDLPERVQSCKQDFVLFRVWKRPLTLTSGNPRGNFIQSLSFHLIRHDAMRI